MATQELLFGEPAPRAVFSACEVHLACAESCTGRRYRYRLEWPTYVPGGAGIALWVLANPSTATPDKPDPTVTRCITYSRDWGFAWCHVVNVRAWRETIAKKVPPDPIAIGPDNDRHIAEAARAAHLVICGWGKLGGARGPAVLALLRAHGAVPHALQINESDQSPGHPLYLSKKLRPFPLPP